jgi:hypothetical protein
VSGSPAKGRYNWGRSYHQGKSHDNGSDKKCEATARSVDDEHLYHGTSRLQCALNTAGKQGYPVIESQCLEECWEVVLHGGCPAHLSHELQESRSPHAGEETAVREQRDPGEAGYPEDGNGALNLCQLGLDLIRGEVTFAVEL